MGERILMKLDIYENLMLQMLNFQFESDPGTKRIGGETEILETGNLEKRLEWRDRDEP